MEFRANVFLQIILYSLLVDTKVRCLLRTRRESTTGLTSVHNQVGRRLDNISERYGYNANVNSNLNVNANSGNDNEEIISYRRSFTSIDQQRGKKRGYDRNVNVNINTNGNF